MTGRTQKALILSGGGGRGAYHVGVIQALTDYGWMPGGQPDILAGTSIGAINAAALAAGVSPRELQRRWMLMHTEHVHRLSPHLPAVSRPLLRFMLHSVLTSSDEGEDAVLPPDERAMSADGLLTRLRRLFTARPFQSLLDTQPWRNTLATWMNFDLINSAAAPALLLTATDVQRGTLRLFCNRPRAGRPADIIGLDHLLASSSIPVVYPWTEIDDTQHWDGAVLANTPLGPVIDLAGDDPLDMVVVMMTPWHTDEADVRAQLEQLPADMVQGLALALDWALLGSYRTALKLLKSYNRLADAAERLERAATLTGDETLRMPGPVPRRIAEPLVIAPERLMPMEWIVDYEPDNHRSLIAQGYEDAVRALERAGRITAPNAPEATENSAAA